MGDRKDSFFSGDNQPTELSVSDVSNALKCTVEDAFSFVRVRGEISGFKRAASGHLYMDLKDENSVINSVCWKGATGRISFIPADGIEVIVTGKITTYAPRSNYQLVISSMEIAGEGALLKILEERKKALEKEGLFDASLKKAIPRLPKRIGVVTSPTGSVIRDILHRIQGRFPTPVYIYPCRVQGQGSASEITNGIDFFNTHKDGIEKVDVIIVARGGGNIEDLWAFNEECIARAVHRSVIPVISAVGHETDTTLIDYVSDLRVSTPTAAAEMAVPVLQDVKNYVDNKALSMNTVLSRMIQERALRLQALKKSLPDVDTILNVKIQRMDHITTRLTHIVKNRLLHTKNSLGLIAQKLIKPDVYIVNLDKLIKQIGVRLSNVGTQVVTNNQHRLSILEGLLESYSFKKTLERGFALVRDNEGNVIKDIKSANKAEKIRITFFDGDIDVKNK